MKRRSLAISLVGLTVAGCVNPYVQQQQQQAAARYAEQEQLKGRTEGALMDCNSKYGYFPADTAKWGEHEIPTHWKDWEECKNNVMLRYSQGTEYYPYILEIVSYDQLIDAQFLKGKITRTELRALHQQKFAEVLQRQTREIHQQQAIDRSLQLQQQQLQQETDARNSQIMRDMSRQLLNPPQPTFAPTFIPAGPTITDCNRTGVGINAGVQCITH